MIGLGSSLRTPAAGGTLDFRSPRCFPLPPEARLRLHPQQTDVAPVEIERRVLIFDSPNGELQHLALDLIGRDFDVHYANDIDEAQMLAR